MSRELVAHLQAGASTPFEWGSADCTTFVCDWIQAVRGRDPDAEFRGRYRTARGANLHLRRGGGLVVLARRCFSEIGMSETTDPRPGDVGVVEQDGAVALAIRTERGWAAKSLRGVVCGPFPVVVAWTV